MKTLLGFAVLTSPLWLILILIPVAIWIAAKVSKRVAGAAPRSAVGVLIFVAVIAAPFADHISGKVYFANLCKTHAGVQIYQTVALPSEFWDEQGKPKFIERNGDLNEKILGARFRRSVKSEPYLSALGLTRYRNQVIDAGTERLLGEVINFMFWGGWIMRNLSSSGPTADSCSDIRGSAFWRDFYLRLFTRSDAVR